MIASDGDSRRSSVRALNVSPQRRSCCRSTSPPAASTILSVTRSNCSSLTAITPSSRSKEYPASVGDLEQRPRVLREAAPAPARAGAEEVLADALVVAEAEHDVVDVGADALADRRDGVDERQLGGEEGVGGVLDRLGRRRVGDDDRRGDAEVQRRHLDRRRLVGAADDDAVGLQEVLHGRALAEELGVRHDLDVGPVEHPLDDPGRADRHRRLVDDDALVRQVRRDLRAPPPRCRTGRRCRPRPAGSARTGTRCRSPTTAFAAPTHEAQPPGPQALLDEPVEAVLDDRDLAGRQAGDLVGVDVGADDLVPEVGEAGARGQSRRSPSRRWRFATCAEATGRSRRRPRCAGSPTVAAGRSLRWTAMLLAPPPDDPGARRRLRRRPGRRLRGRVGAARRTRCSPSSPTGSSAARSTILVILLVAWLVARIARRLVRRARVPLVDADRDAAEGAGDGRRDAVDRPASRTPGGGPGDVDRDGRRLDRHRADLGDRPAARRSASSASTWPR